MHFHTKVSPTYRPILHVQLKFIPFYIKVFFNLPKFEDYTIVRALCPLWLKLKMHIHLYPGAENQDLRAKQYEDFITVFQGLDPDVKLVCVCGNHDIGDTPTKATLQVYRNQFGSDIFSFFVGGVKFIVLNSQYFQAPDALPKETKRQLDFISKDIADPAAKHIG